MRKSVHISLIFFLSVIGLYAQTINSKKSRAEFEIDKMSFGSVEGTIKGMRGIVIFDPSNLSSSMFDVTISPSTIDTDSEKMEHHLRNEDFFDVENYLTIRFKSTSIVKKENSYLAKGKLTILETTKEIELPFTVSKVGGKSTFIGNLEINRFNYNLASEAYKSTMMVGKIATVKIICVTE